ncbi:MAG TPA: hypothetical protein VF175_16170, partial [Lacipirellula sp.]
FPVTAEQLKTQYTDKYVKVDASRPELARFRDVVGQVKTVNMNGRALVEFLDYHLNIGWFDIDVSCLTVVDKPSEDLTAKPEPKRAHDKPAGKAAPTTGDKQVADAKAPAGGGGEKKLSPLELARMQGAGGKAAAPAKSAGNADAPAKKSTADILAAARGGAAKPASGGETPAAPAAKPASGGKMSTTDILAAARGKASAPTAVAPATPATAAPPQAEAPAPPPPAPAAEPAAPASAGGVVKVDRSSMTVEQMIDYCRAKDAQ